MAIYNFDLRCICVFVHLYLCICKSDTRPGALFLRSWYHYIFENIAHVMSICNFDQCCICIFVYLYLCICKSATRNIVSEVLLPLPFQKYSTCHVYLQLWPILYMRICVFVYLCLCIWKSDSQEHCFWGPLTLTNAVFAYLCICVFASQTPRNIVSEVLLPLFFQKYSTCYVYLQLWPML